MTPGSRALRLLGLTGLVLLGLLPLLPLLSRAVPALTPLERACDVWFDLHCHRDPARTLFVAGTPLAVCARCSGIYFGLGSGALLRRPRLTPRALRLWVLGAATVMIVDVLLEARGLHGAWSGLRLLTGAALGYPVGAALGALTLSSPTADG